VTAETKVTNNELKMKIIIGLGNPGFRYRNTRHNVGFLAVQGLAKKYKINIKKKGFGGVYGIGRIKREEVMLFKPMTFMNLSGEAVNSLYSSKLDDISDLLIINDDISMPLGTTRMREKGSSGGHNGLKSIIENIGSDFARFKIGIGSENQIDDVSRYVLSNFTRKQRKVLDEMLEETMVNIENWIEKGIRKP
jgi:peptidyl-tRNA hydrolase, PTH1 family